MSAPRQLLLVEDDDDHAALFERVVRKLSGWSVGAHARTLDEAALRLDAGTWDAVVLDLNLRESRGLETIERLSPASLRAPVVVLSSLQDEETAEGVLRAGAEDYLYKSEVDPWSLGRSLHHATARFEMRKTLQQRSRDLELVTAAAAHDMRGPLRHIRSFLQLHERCTPGEPCNCLARIDAASLRLNDLLDSLAAYLRIGLARDPHAPVDLNEIAAAAREFHAGEIASLGASLELAPLPRVYGDAHQLGVLLRNLVGNALTHSGPEAPRVRVWSDHAAPEGMARVVVGDEGPGVPERARRTIFEPFQRGSEAASSGTGLGLTICERIVTQHGGTIDVESNERGGSDFWFTLPAVRE